MDQEMFILKIKALAELDSSGDFIDDDLLVFATEHSLPPEYILLIQIIRELKRKK